jgi:O-acetylhomoserine/O-acetylserine sulfhydrylase-like pyridoxal-dependent enzyme
MSILRENFYLEIKDTEQIVVSEFPEPTATWDKKIPVMHNANLEIHTSVSNGKIFEYKTEANIYTRLLENPQANSLSNNVALVSSVTFGHHPGANAYQMVENLFPQYFTE